MASEPIQVRFSEVELAGLDRVRGDAPRGTWIKEIIGSAVAARERAGEPCKLVVRYVGEVGVPGENIESNVVPMASLSAAASTEDES